ncbi:hypothetical protein OKW50_003478 [Paraburkholderia youngii]|uniref:hypothetical protein n=1 Tax=Paraburkholderia youngii TaxID=2782701 RepID=UPI003D1FFD76
MGTGNAGPLTRYRVTFLTMVFALVAALMMASSPAEAAISTPVKAPNFTGTLNVTKFATQTVNGVAQLVAIGSLTGTVNGPNGTLQNVAIGNIVMPVTSIGNQTCPILALTLGPLHLNLLGVVIDLNQIVLNITAVAGAGNLLGNLLCDVAGLLNNPSEINSLVTLLNQILGML